MTVNEQTYVMPEARVKILGSDFRFVGEARPVDIKGGNVLDYLRAAGVYNSKADVNSDPIWFDNNFSIRERLEKLDDAMPFIDVKRLKKDLDKKGYAFLMTNRNSCKFHDYNRGYLAYLDRVTQDILFQKLAKELNINVRHLKAQELTELMLSDRDFSKVIKHYDVPTSEVIQVMKKQPFYGHISARRLDLSNAVESLVPIKVSSVESDHYSFSVHSLDPEGDSGCIVALKIST